MQFITHKYVYGYGKWIPLNEKIKVKEEFRAPLLYSPSTSQSVVGALMTLIKCLQSPTTPVVHLLSLTISSSKSAVSHSLLYITYNEFYVWPFGRSWGPLFHSVVVVLPFIGNNTPMLYTVETNTQDTAPQHKWHFSCVLGCEATHTLVHYNALRQ